MRINWKRVACLNRLGELLRYSARVAKLLDRVSEKLTFTDEDAI